MLQELTAVVYAHKLKQEAQSLEYPQVVPANASTAFVVHLPDGVPLSVKRTAELHALGVMVDSHRFTWTSVHHRLMKGGSYFWAHSNPLCAANVVKPKLQSWNCGPAVCALLGSSCWHVSCQLLVNSIDGSSDFFAAYFARNVPPTRARWNTIGERR